MVTVERLELMHLAAVLYYTANKTQNEIAEELSVSRQTVSRLLIQAREEGIVKITITNPFASMELLAGSVQKAINLNTVIVIPGEDGSQAQIRGIWDSPRPVTWKRRSGQAIP